MSRDRQGRWNFAPFIKPSAGPPGRAWIREVIVRGVSVRYVDAALPRAEGRRDAPVRLGPARLDAKLFLGDGGETGWSALVQLSGGLGKLRCTGRYEASRGSWHCTVRGRDIVWPQVADRFLPIGIAVQGARFSGTVTVMDGLGSGTPASDRRGRPADPGPVTVAALTFSGGNVRTLWVSTPISVRTGRAVLDGNALGATALLDVGGANVRADLAMDVSSVPRYRIGARAATKDIRKVFRYVRALDPYASRLTGARGSATASVRISGKGTRARLTALGNLSLRGELPRETVVSDPASVQVSVSGPLGAPSVRMAAQAPKLNVRGVHLTDVRASALLADGRVQAVASGHAAGGQVAAVGEMTLSGGQTFRCAGTARNTALAKVVEGIRAAVGPTSDLGRKLDPGDRAAPMGVASADVTLAGSIADGLHHADANAQVLGVKLDNLEMDSAEIAGSLDGDLVTVERARLRRGAAEATASGIVHLTDMSAHVEVEAEGWSLAELSRWAGLSSETRVGGLISLRNGLISGDLRRPGLRGTIYGSGIEIGDHSVDYAVAAVEGSPDSVILDGEAVRVPSIATVNGFIRRPFTERPWLSLSVHGNDLDLADLATITEEKRPMAGLATADAYVAGPINEPKASPIVVHSDRIWLGDIVIDDVNGAGSARLQDGRPIIELTEATAWLGDGRVSGMGRYSGGDFDVTARMVSVALGAFSDLTSSYVDLTGSMDGQAMLLGRRDADGRLRLRGSASMRSAGLTVNGENLGDIAVRATLDGDQVAGSTTAADGPPFRWGVGSSGIKLDDYLYNLETGRFLASGSADAMQVEALRRAVARSPGLAGGSSGADAARVLAGLEPVRGTFSLSGSIAGTPDDWIAHADFDGTGLSVERFRADSFTARIEATGEKVKLGALELRSGDAILSAEGELHFGREIQGAVSAQSLDLATLAQWLPPQHPVSGLSGTLDSISAEIGGKPQTPEVSVSMSARDVRFRPPDAPIVGDTMVVVPAIRLASATVREGLLSLDDLAVTLATPQAQTDAPSNSGTQGSGRNPVIRPLEVHASGQIPFTWESPYISDEARGEVTVRLPETDLASIQALVPGAAVEMSGTVGAEVRVSATRADLDRIAGGEADAADTLDVSGSAWLKADQIRALRMRTVLGDIDLRASVERGLLSLGSSSGDGPVARAYALGATPGQREEAGAIYVSGNLPVRSPSADGNVLAFRIPRLAFDEAPLPGFSTGRISGALTGSGVTSARQESRDARVVVSGSVLQPHISGSARLERLAIRLPVTEGQPRPARSIPPINPTFDLGFYVSDDATVRSNQLNVNLGTPIGEPVRVLGSLGEPRVAGSLAVKGGALTFPTARFAIRPGGTISLRYPGAGALGAEDAGLDVAVDVTAQARMSAASVTGQVRRYLLTVEAKGPLLEQPGDAVGGAGKLKLTYRSDPPDLALSQDGLARRITAMLGGQDALNAVFSQRGDAGSVLVGKVVDYLGGALMPDLVDQTGVGRALGLSELNVDYSQVGALVLRLSRDLPGPFEVGYWKQLSSARSTLSDQGDWELRLSARLPNRFRLSWTHNDQRTNVYRLEGVYSF